MNISPAKGKLQISLTHHCAQQALKLAFLALLNWCAAPTGLAAEQDKTLVCEKAEGRKEPVCVPSALSDLLGQIQQARQDFDAKMRSPIEKSNTTLQTVLAMAHMAPNFCLDVEMQFPPPDCSRSADSGRTTCVSKPAVEPKTPGVVTLDFNAAPTLSLYLAYMAVLRATGKNTAAAETLLGGTAIPSHSETWGLAYLERALQEDLRGSDARAIVNDLLMLAGVFVRSGDLVRASERLASASQRASEDEAKAAVQVSLGVVSALQGDYAKAIEHLNKAVSLYRLLHDSNASREADIAGSCASSLSLNEARKALAAKSVRTGLELSLINLGAVHGQLGQFEQSVAYLRQAVALYASAGGRGAAAGLVTMATVSQRAERRDDAKRFIDEAAKSGPSLLLTMSATYSSGIELRPSANTLAGRANHPASDAMSSAQPTAFESTAVQAERRGQPAAALAAYRQAALVAKATSASDALRAALANLQKTAFALQQTELSIYYGKRAVNEIQQQRAGLSKLPRNVRRSFVTLSRPVYETLAEALFMSNRLAEAEHAMLLMHQDDLAEFGSARSTMPMNAAERDLQAYDEALAATWRNAATQREVALAKAPARRIISPAEIDLQFESLVEFAVNSLAAMQPLQAFNSRLGALLDPSGKSTASEVERAKGIEGLLKPLECNGVDMDPRLQQLRNEAVQLRKVLTERGNVPQASTLTPASSATNRTGAGAHAGASAELKCTQFEQAAAEATAAAPDERVVAKLLTVPGALTREDQVLVERTKSALEAHGTGPAMAALHYLITDRKLHILVVTRAGRAVRSLNIGREAINDQVGRFRRALQTPGSDPLGLAKALHASLIAPVADLLKGVSLLQLALDGKLRYVPFAALHDGRRWLIENFALTIGSPSESRMPSVGQPWRLAGFGVTAAAPGFDGLPGVAEELKGLVRDEAKPNQGLITGIIHLDRAFTARTLREALAQRYPVVHIASHFALGSEIPDESFLLLGDGSRLSLKSIRDDFRFDGVELVTLSACNTALDNVNGYGQEFEGLAAILRQQGAASVLATLWPVADASTGRFMRNFYSRQGPSRLSRAEALRHAQLEFIGGLAVTPGVVANTRGGEVVSVTVPAVAVGGSLPSGAGATAHPFYWAPFVLSGDWR
jgi:CHAT domain-containing protein/tetratricopeptide (TPR) repeat protein